MSTAAIITAQVRCTQSQARNTAWSWAGLTPAAAAFEGSIPRPTYSIWDWPFCIAAI